MICACVSCEHGMPSMCMAKALRYKSQTVAIVLRDPGDALMLERAVGERGLHFHEVRPSVFTIEPIPAYLR
jgi:hypothetical protein